MRPVVFIVFGILLVACAGTAEDARNTLSGRFAGQSVDLIVAQYGPPANTFKMHNGDTSYLWQLGNQTSINSNEYGGSARTHYCKLSVIADPKGMVKSVNTEDASNLVGESLCSQRLGIQRST